jgi:hypothetical protein
MLGANFFVIVARHASMYSGVRSNAALSFLLRAYEPRALRPSAHNISYQPCPCSSRRWFPIIPLARSDAMKTAVFAIVRERHGAVAGTSFW